MRRLANHGVAVIGLGLLILGPVAAAAGAPVAGRAAVSAAARSASAAPERWAYPQAAAVVHETSSGRSPAVGRLHFLTEDGQAEVYQALQERTVPPTGATWIEITVPRRPNGVVGWVRASVLGPLHLARGRLVIDRSTLRATLFDGSNRAIWSAPVGVGRGALPTPSGDFYVREKLRSIGGPAYGPYAIGTSAYAPSLSEWPGGGVVGIHGTNEPQLIPGRPSHGCVRLRNADIVRLWRLIAIGTPVDIT